MTSPVLLTGGTGTLGSLVAPLLRDAGQPVRVLSRQPHSSGNGTEYVTGDLATGEGLDAALDSIGTIVHCAGSAKGDEGKARHLVHAASAAGVEHLVHISVVGADRIPVVSGIDRAMFGYFAAQRAAEAVVADSGVPWTVLRATQFHDFVLTAAQQLTKMPVVPVPKGVKFQPVDAREVAAQLVELALDKPAGRVPDIAGPYVYGMDELIRDYLRARGKRRPLVRVGAPGRAARAYRKGANLNPDRAVGTRTWEDFLAERVRGDR
ncbi:SDR family oxidoreductase [Streptomyces iconiensis]|uniref:NAD(P)H-binding protein n=1 Tax=Streptomyces iconiensis TaxID=1384038 RepID=A0ABT6ZN65_9ACTN|nr:NAD(P)H-binding protein [Streptomyces iconiensis]MDJ1130491.1 NAD(P)H-binding protein [Streptomyces iconiensis]